MNDQDYAVVVGISKYGSLQPQLDGPELDATEFARWLRAPDGGDVPDKNVTLIRSSDFATQNAAAADAFSWEPTLARVYAAFARLISTTVKNFGSVPRAGRRLYIYLAGHGLTPRVDPLSSDNQSGLLMANCVEDVLYDNIPGQAYADWFRRSHAFAEIVLFMDCCRTDKPDVAAVTTLPKIVEGGRPNDVRVFYAWATQWDTRAFELQVPPPPATGVRRGVFTYALIEALQNSRPDSGRVTPKAIWGDVIKRVLELRKGDDSQRPVSSPSIPDDDIVLTTRAVRAPDPNLTLTFAPALVGKPAVLLDGAYKQIDTRVVDDQPWTLALAPGLYALRVDGRDTVVPMPPGEVKRQAIG